jgi:lysine biosynthesis protein LysW
MDLKTKRVGAACPGCGWLVIPGAHPRESQLVTCPNCEAYLEVINLDPLELDWTFTEFESDWDLDLGEEEWDEDDEDEEKGD